MQRKYVTKKLVIRIGSLTNDIFRQCIVEAIGIKNTTHNDVSDFLIKMRYISNGVYDNLDEDEEEIKNKREKADELYLIKIIALPTVTLTDILFLHERRAITRADRTLEAIISELARRSLLDDSSEFKEKESNVNL